MTVQVTAVKPGRWQAVVNLTAEVDTQVVLG